MYKTLEKYASIRNLFCKLCKVMSSVSKFQDTIIRQKIDLLNQIGDRHSIKYTQLKVSTMFCKSHIFKIEETSSIFKGKDFHSVFSYSWYPYLCFPKIFPYHNISSAWRGRGPYKKLYLVFQSTTRSGFAL